MIWYCETISNKSEKPGPIDPRTNWPTHHPDFMVTAETLEEAEAYFAKKYPDDIMAVYPEKTRSTIHYPV